MIKKASILLFCLLSLHCVQAQQDVVEPETSRFSIGFTPQYLIIGGMRVDLDISLTRKAWLTLSPTFYFSENSTMFSPESMDYAGVGFAANYRYFPSGKGVYVGAALNYKFISSEYERYYEISKEEAIFNTYGFDMSLGYQFLIVDKLFMDLYLGWGFRYSTEDSPESKDYWSDAILSMAYSGFLPVAGCRIGYEF